ncbi:hypothetical protein ACFQYP_18815 [Nonomuraea antimicrobica]|uniref:hypothetical protein n=1 Tax=Nonomuraea antimicrobica TaxID=561173 RepID=UPI0031EB39A6
MSPLPSAGWACLTAVGHRPRRLPVGLTAAIVKVGVPAAAEAGVSTRSRHVSALQSGLSAGLRQPPYQPRPG